MPVRHALSTLPLAVFVLLLEDVAATVQTEAGGREPLTNKAAPNVEWYFWNELTGETQWEDPGDVAFEDANAQRYWEADTGEILRYDPKAHRYSWVENWSSEHSRPFYFNQKTRASQWEKPDDLAWRRVKVTSADGTLTLQENANTRVMDEL